MAKWEVVVEGGGANLYTIAEVRGIFVAYKTHGTFLPEEREISRSASLQGSLTVIERHAGRRVYNIKKHD